MLETSLKLLKKIYKKPKLKITGDLQTLKDMI